MKKFISYRNIVTLFVFITIWAILWSFSCNTHTGTNRYQLFKDSNNTILLDKQTGMTWRNVWNNNNIPCQWEYMEHTDNINLPIGPKIAYYKDKESSYDLEKFLKQSDYNILNQQDKKYVNRLTKANSFSKKRKIAQEMKSKGYKKEQFEKFDEISSYVGKDKNFWTDELKPYKYVFY